MDLKVEVVKIGKVEKHPNADSLSMSKVFDYPVIFQTGSFQEGDLAAFVPVDAVVPATEAWSWIHGGADDVQHRRIKAKRLRGIYSEGLLIPLSSEYFPGKPAETFSHEWWASEGDDLTADTGITKYDPGPLSSPGSENRSALPKGGPLWNPIGLPHYTDIQNIRRYPDVLQEGEPVLIQEKIHGANARYGFLPVVKKPVSLMERLAFKLFKWKRKKSMFVVGSHNAVRWVDQAAPEDWKKNPENLNWWHKAALRHAIETICRRHPGMVLFGEVFGDVQDLRYCAVPGSKTVEFRLFDVYDTVQKKYLDADAMRDFAYDNGLTPAPMIYRGPWFKDRIADWRDGDTLESVEHAGSCVPHLREGFVVRPLVERAGRNGERIIFKAVSPDYLVRKGGKEAKE